MVGRQKSSPICKVQEEIKDMEWYNKDKEEKLERVKRKQLEWVSSKLCRSVLIEMMNESVEEVENRHVIEMVNSMVVESWKRLEVNRLVKDILNSEDNIKLRVVTILMEKNTEDKELLDTLEREESKLRRLKRIEMLKNTCKNKMQAKKLRSMLQMLRKLSLDELEIDFDEMDVVDRDNVMGLESKSGVIPKVTPKGGGMSK